MLLVSSCQLQVGCSGVDYKWEGNIGEETLQLLMDDGEDRVVNDEWRIGNVYEVVS